jgi:putative flippase GtrA
MNPRRPDRRELGPQVIKFLLVGLLNTAIQYLVFLTLYEIVRVNYLVASTAGYCLGILNSYVLNKRWTFASATGEILPEAMRFATVNLVALGTNTGLLFLLVSTQNMQPRFAQLWALASSVSVNFVLNRYWTFAQGAEPPRPSAMKRTDMD